MFEGRNKEYGAYQLRKGTSKRNIWSIIIVALAAALLFLGLTVHRMAEPSRTVMNMQAVEVANIKKDKKDVKVEKKDPVKVEPERIIEKVKSSVKFTAPVIRKDNLVKEEDEIKLDEIEKSTKAIGALTVDGNDELGGEVLKIFEVVEQNPTFPGGTAALMSWLSQNIKYPVIAAENGVKGRVIVQFVVEKDGSITDVVVVKSVDPSLDKEATRVIKNMPHWIPGRQNGSPVRVRFTVPVTFTLQ